MRQQDIRFAIILVVGLLSASARAQSAASVLSFSQSSSGVGGGGSLSSTPVYPYVLNETASVTVDPHIYAGSASLTGSWVFTVSWGLSQSVNPAPTVLITYTVPEYASAMAQCQPQGSSDVSSSSDLSTSKSQAVPPPPSPPYTSSANTTWKATSQNVPMSYNYILSTWQGTATVAAVSLSTNAGQSGPGGAMGNGQTNIASYSCSLKATP